MHPHVAHPRCRPHVAAILGLFLAAQLMAEEQPPSPHFMPVQVVLRDEREFIAYVGERTDDEILWLRFSRGRAMLSTGFTWDLVRSVQVGADPFTAAEFRDVAIYFASNQVLHSHISGPESLRAKGLRTSDPQWIQNDRFRAKVQSLSIRASVTNWDRDADSDGLELHLTPRDANGDVVAVSGSIKVELFGRSYSPVRGSPPVLTLGKWSQPIPVTAISNRSEAICRLPFLSQSFDHSAELQSMGLLRVQLNVAGQGDFFAESWVRIRTYNPVRDDLLNHSQHHDAFGRYRARHW